jgi:uncharacterized membrane protein YbhN (UPF0104 family)
MRWQWWVAYVLASMAVQVMRLVRWADQLRALGEGRLMRSLSIGAIGLTAIFFLPARLGELVRPVWIASREGIGVGEATSTVISERLIDGVMVGLLLVGTGLWVGYAGGLPRQEVSMIQRSGLLVGGVFMALMALIWGAALLNAQTQSLLSYLLGRWPALHERASGSVTRFHGGVLTLLRGRIIARYVTLSALLWLCNVLLLLLLFEGFQLGLPASSAFVVLGATAVGILVPAGAASIGPLHLAVVWSLGLFSVEGAVALNVATLLHLGQVVSNGAIGAIGAVALKWLGRQRAE